MMPPVEVSLIVTACQWLHRAFRDTQASWIPPLSNIPKSVSLRRCQHACVDKRGNFLMESVRISDVIFVGQFIDVLQILLVFRKKLVAMQPMLKEAVEGCNVHLPLLDSYT